jgi:hypothetical protein
MTQFNAMTRTARVFVVLPSSGYGYSDLQP